MKKVLFLLMAAFAWIQVNAADVSDNYIEKWGRLKLVGIQLSSESGEAIQLKGWSSFGFYGENCLTSANDLESMKGAGANCVRIARYLGNGSGSIDDNGIKNWMSWTAQKGMYCVIDWHILEAANGDGNPGKYTNDAKNFFRMVAQEVADKKYKHIIYELCNEPSGVGWGTIKSYAEEVIRTIVAIDKNKPVVIVGTPNWDQYIYSQVASTGNLINTNDAYVMYAFHLYANEAAHVGLESSEFLPASTRIPIFVSEWGLSSAQPEKRGSYDDVNTSFATTFLRHCAGYDGCGQIVSWMNWSYGMKREGSSTFKDRCGGELSPSGKFIQEMLGGELKPVVTACYGGICFELGADSEDATLNLGFYDDNPEKQDGDWAASSGITYYDANNTDEEGYTKATATTYDEKETIMSENKNSNVEREVLKCYAGRDWCDFRIDECVDVTGACIEGSWSSGLYNLGWVCAGEWLLYTFDVKDPGYYSMQMAVNTSDESRGIGSTKCDEETGECVATGAGGFILTLKDHASQVFMVDVKKSTPTEPVAMSAEQYAPYIDGPVNGKTSKDGNDKVWCYTGDHELGMERTYDGILFKEAGKHVVKMSFPNGHVGIGGLRFTYEKPYTGEGYPEEINNLDGTSVEKILNNTESIVYPSVVADGIINVAAEGKADVKIFNLVGAEVYSTSIEGASKLAINLAAGVYNVEVASAEGSKFAKIIVK